jgi:hypothetical protein
LGKYADTEMKIVRGRSSLITTGRHMAEGAIDDLTNWRYKRLR